MHDYKREQAVHVLQSSANMVGVCLFVITGIRALNLGGVTLIDQAAAGASVLFLISAFAAYISLRPRIVHVVRYRDVADYCFLTGLVILVFTISGVAFSVIA